MSIIIPANSAVGGGFGVDNSVRYNGSNDSMNRTFAAGNQKTWTWSMWIKRSKLSVDQTLFGRMTSTGDAGWFNMSLNSDDTITFGIYNTSYRKTNRVFRDISAWYNIVLAFDTTQGTAANRIKFYINGVEETSFSTSNDPSQNFDGPFNANAVHSLGIQPIPSGYEKYYGGYISEVTFIDGQALDPTSFGEFDEDSGIFKPISVSGLTFGTNGFYLPFTNSGALGEDYSGEDHDWTTVNLAATDQSTDSCTNNSATWNPLFPSSGTTAFSEGNLKLVSSGTNGGSMSSFGVSSGKWYIEVKQTAVNEPLGNGESLIAVAGDPTGNLGNLSGVAPTGSAYYGIRNYNGTKFANDPSENSSANWHGNWTAGDIISIALDMDNNNVYFAKNGQYANGSGSWNQAFTGSPAAIALSTGKTFYFISAGHAHGSATETFELNCFSPSFAISSGNADADGYGNFEYAVPSGYFSLNTKNLAEYG